MGVEHRFWVAISGKVSRAASETFGDGSLAMQFGYAPAEKNVSGSGSYAVQLEAPLSAATGDLSLCKLASNFLEGVWRIDGTVGNTGDMTEVQVGRDGTLSEVWVPSTAAPGHFPSDECQALDMTVVGDWNQVDVYRQDGLHPIQAAQKPTVGVAYASPAPVDGGIRFGAWYSPGSAQDYTADNIGITPLVSHASGQTSFTLDVLFESMALPADGNAIEAILTATMPPGEQPDLVDTYFGEALGAYPLVRYVGELGPFSNGLYRGNVYVPFADADPGRHTAGFFHAVAH